MPNKMPCWIHDAVTEVALLSMWPAGDKRIARLEEIIARHAIQNANLPESFKQHQGFMDLYSEWHEHRGKMTKVTVRRQIKKMERWGIEKSMEILNTAMDHGWTGLFEPKSNHPPLKPSVSFRPAVRESRDAEPMGARK